MQIGSHLIINNLASSQSTQQAQDQGQQGAAGTIIQALTSSLNMTPSALRSALQSGQSLQQIAQSQGVSMSSVQQALTSAVNTAEQNGQLTQQQGQQLDSLVNSANFGSSPQSLQQLMGAVRGGHHHHHGGGNAGAANQQQSQAAGPSATYQSSQPGQEMQIAGS